jgi:siroheme synthase
LPFEVVPGVSSVVAAPAAAGIPVTHRGVSASFTVVTGHRQRGESAVNWTALAQAGGTIVVLMGVSERGVIAAELIAGGLAPDTPVAAIRHATSVDQHVIRCALSDLADTPVESPATIVIGPVAAFDLYVNLAERLPASVNPHG